MCGIPNVSAAFVREQRARRRNSTAATLNQRVQVRGRAAGQVGAGGGARVGCVLRRCQDSKISGQQQQQFCCCCFRCLALEKYSRVLILQPSLLFNTIRQTCIIDSCRFLLRTKILHLFYFRVESNPLSRQVDPDR